MGCWDYALISLGKFPARYNDLEDELIPSSSKGNNERVQSSNTAPLPGRLETLHLRSGGISKPLMKHETQMRIVRKETQITFRGDEMNKIVKTTTYIKSHSDWAYDEYSEIADLTKDILAISNKIEQILGNRSEEIVIGRCPTVMEDGVKCSMALKVDPARLHSTSEIKCRKCDTVWDSTKWRLLGRILDEAAR
jgi:hypothetical protein